MTDLLRIRIFRWAKLKLSNARPGDMPVISYDRLMNTGPERYQLILGRDVVRMNPFLIDENLIDECRLDECTNLDERRLDDKDDAPQRHRCVSVPSRSLRHAHGPTVFAGSEPF